MGQRITAGSSTGSSAVPSSPDRTGDWIGVSTGLSSPSTVVLRLRSNPLAVDNITGMAGLYSDVPPRESPGSDWPRSGDLVCTF